LTAAYLEGTNVNTLRPLCLLLLFAQVSLAQTTFTKPSEAYEFAQRPVTESEAALHARALPTGSPAPSTLVRKRSRELCPAFQLEGVSGEELYWLAMLCEEYPPKALPAVQRYLAGNNLEHAPDARLVLAVQQMRTNGSWEAAWGTFRTMLQEDPIEPVWSQLEVAIDGESDKSPEKALEWSKERYAILLGRSLTEKPGVPPVSASWVISAGSDLVHRYYLAGDTGEATRLLGEMNSYVKSHPVVAGSWGEEDLYWANMEMHPAPAVAVLKMLGGNLGPDLFRQGRVEVVSFFFLGCAPCMTELPRLNDLQKRYGKKKLLVADVTTYKANSYLTPPSKSNIEAVLEKARLENAPDIEFVITPEETLDSHDVHAFPVVVLVDKKGRVRFVGRIKEFPEDDSSGRLIKRLLEE
jgi:thiol-disulfide isomerase/thioredoxin